MYNSPMFTDEVKKIMVSGADVFTSVPLKKPRGKLLINCRSVLKEIQFFLHLYLYKLFSSKVPHFPFSTKEQQTCQGVGDDDI